LHQTSRTTSTRRKAKKIVKGFRTPSWFRAKRNVELKQVKAKISKPRTDRQKKGK
jgi:hypothetical protein